MEEHSIEKILEVRRIWKAESSREVATCVFCAQSHIVNNCLLMFSI